MPSDWIYTDPLFYLAAIPAILLIGISKSGFGSGFGGLAVPLIALTVTVPEAAAVLMPLLFVLDLLALRAYREAYDKPLLKSLLPWSILGVLVGFLLFKYLNSHLVEGVVGLFALAFVAQRLLFPPSPQGVVLPGWIGATLTTMSGFTSFISHSGGPPFQIYVLPQRLPKLVFAGTSTIFFAIINASKIWPYQALRPYSLDTLVLAGALIPFAIAGTVAGAYLTQRIHEKWFYWFIQVSLFAVSIKLVVMGLG